MNPIRLTDNSFYEERFIEPGLPLIISFAGLGDKYEFKKTLAHHSVNVIFLRDLSHQWYLNDLPTVGCGVSEISKFLSDRIIELKPPKVVAIGTSAGGFAAMLYGALLEVDVICVFSPQSFRSKLLCLLTWDYRWLDRVVDIYEGTKMQPQYLDLKPMMRNYKGSLSMYYDQTNRLDNAHSKRIIGANISHHKFKFGGHNLVQELKKLGKLIHIIEEGLG